LCQLVDHRAGKHDHITGLPGQELVFHRPDCAECAFERQPGLVGDRGDDGLRRAGADDIHQSTLAPDIFTMLAHLAMSSFMYWPNSSGDMLMGAAPCLAQASLTSALPTTLRISAFRRSTMGLGVPAGATIPSQMVASYP